MPLPKPNAGENRSDFISRCMSNSNVQQDSSSNDQALAICNSLWDRRNMSTNEKLLNLIKLRSQKKTAFGHGITTADNYVRTLQECVGIDICYRYATTTSNSFDDVLRKAAKTLVYSNEDMVIQEKTSDIEAYKERINGLVDLKGNEIKMPKNTLMVFKHILTTPKQDRDLDILRTEGAIVDPKMLLLWQHIPTLPIGKMLGILKHDKDSLELISAIVDMNDLSHDSAVMVDNGMGRFSHGFNPLEFEELKEEDEKAQSGGFDIKKFEVMEESLVSVPSNTDAETQEILLSLVEGRKLTSGIMKEYGKQIREKMPLAVAGADIKYSEQIGDYRREFACDNFSDLEKALNTGLIGENKNENQQLDRTNEREEGRKEKDCKCGTSKETDEATTKEEIPIHEEIGVSEVKFLRAKTRDLSGFSPDREYLQASSLEYDWASKWLGCQVKHIKVITTFVPSYRMGSFLCGLKDTIKDWDRNDVRNITWNGKEEPPQYEIIQLNSRISDSFLTEGIEFWKAEDGTKSCIKYARGWTGIYITFYSIDADLTSKTIDKSWEWARENNFLKGEAFSLTGDFISKTDITWEDIMLKEENISAMTKASRLLNDKKKGMVNRGIICLGPPGTGKTLSGKILLNETDASFIWISARDFWRTGSIGGLCTAFDMAKELAPAVIFIEDVDNWMNERTVDVIKTEMDGISKSSGVLTILTTNYPERLPDALIDRPGRFHDVLKYDLPDDNIRKNMLIKWAGELDQKTLDDLIKNTQGYSGAHIYELVSFAKSLKDEEDMELSKALEKAIEKIDAQRELINQAQLLGSNYKPHKGYFTYGDYISADEFRKISGMEEKVDNVKEAMATVIAKATSEQRKQMMEIFERIEKAEKESIKVKEYHALTGMK